MLFTQTDDVLDAAIDEALFKKDFPTLRQLLIECQYQIHPIEQEGEPSDTLLVDASEHPESAMMALTIEDNIRKEEVMILRALLISVGHKIAKPGDLMASASPRSCHINLLQP